MTLTRARPICFLSVYIRLIRDRSAGFQGLIYKLLWAADAPHCDFLFVGYSLSLYSGEIYMTNK